MPSTLANFLSLTLLLSSTCVGAGVSDPNTGPVVKLNYGSFQGNTTGNLVKFLGMPFAAPPVGNLRFAPPIPPLIFAGVHQATSFGAACPQQATNMSIIPGFDRGGATAPIVSSEDCLFINVIKPVDIPAGKKLPVLFWFYGGGFQVGSTTLYAGDSVVARSIALGEPVIYVSSNYRLNALGFLGGQEAQAAGLTNAGLRDQRFALEWVQKHVSAFGGDPGRVTIWGESAGAISVGLHLVLNDGHTEGLFHGGFMESGSPTSLRLRDTTAQQPLFDQLVSDTGCTGRADLVACLRAVSLDTLMAGVNKSPNIFSYTNVRLGWQPSVDGDFIVRDPQVSIGKGLYAKVPIVTGACDDEGTMFSFTTTNITTNAEFLEYMQTNYFDGLLSEEKLNEIGLAYPEDVTQGSPFDTGKLNAITPQFKRIAAIQGDILFQAPRRFFLEKASKSQTAFAFLYKRGKRIPMLGAFHSSDIPEFYGNSDAPDFIGTDALVNFANSGNPTIPHNPKSLLSGVDWKPWDSSVDHPLLTFLDPAPNVTITFDTFRVDAMNLLNSISDQRTATVTCQPINSLIQLVLGPLSWCPAQGD